MVKWEVYQNTKNGSYIIIQYKENGEPKYIRIFENKNSFESIYTMLKAGLNLDVMDSAFNSMNEVWFDSHETMAEVHTNRYRILEDDKYDYGLVRQYFDKTDHFMV